MRSDILKSIVIFSTLYVSGSLSLILTCTNHNIPLMWLPSGFTVLILLFFGVRFWPVLIGYWWCLYLYTIIPRYSEIDDFSNRFYLSVILTTATSVHLFITVKFLVALGGRNLLKSSKNTSLFLIYVILLGGIKAGIAATAGFILLGKSSPDWRLFAVWWLHGINSIYLLVPLGLMISDGRRYLKRIQSREYFVLTLSFIAFTAILFMPIFKTYIHYSFAYIFIFFLVWSSLRFGLAGFSIIASILALFGIYGLSNNSGPFIEPSSMVAFYITQIFIGVFTSMGYLLSSISDEKIRFEQDLKNTAAELVPDMVSQIDTDGNFLSLNPAFESVLGYKREEWLGKNCGLLIHKEDHKELIKAGNRLINQEENYLKVLLRAKNACGNYVELDVRGSAYFKNGKVVSFFAVSRDITEKLAIQKKLKAYTTELEIAHQQLATSHNELEARVAERTEQLTSSNQQLEQFAYVASHDLQEPVRMISLYLQLLKNQYKDKLDGEALKYIDYTLASSKRMKELVRDILIYSRADAYGVANADLDAKVAIEEAKESLRAAIEDNQVTLQYGNLPKVRCEKTPLSQVFQNLIENSIKFKSEEPPVITVKAKEEENNWVFSVSDNGLGIDPFYQSKVFEMFYRLHSREHSQGTGIGLAVCKKIVTILGGRIWVESDGKSGSTFSFTIPKFVSERSHT